MRKLMYSLVATLLLVACNNEDVNESPSTDQQQQEVVSMNEKLLGEWQGLIEMPQMPLEIILNLQKDSGHFSVPAQGLTEYPIKNVNYNNSKLSVEIDLAGSLIKINGKLKDAQIEATFTQNGQTFPLVLKPYMEASVTYEELVVPVTGGQLRVALQMPHKPTGALAIIHAGSGPTNKDGNTIGSGKNNSLKMLAEDLADQGIASIRYDKRGIGDNAALITKEEDLTFDRYVEDVKAITDSVKKDERFSTIHLIGHSEGALIMTIAAKQNEVASLTLLAGAGRPIDEILLEQLAASLPPNLLTESKVALEKLKAGQRVANVSKELQALFRPSVQPYMMSWLQYNPQQELKDVAVPILILQGKKDIQITEVDANALQGGNSNAKVRYFKDMNHILKDIDGDQQQNIASYTNPDLPLAKGLIEEIVLFIN